MTNTELINALNERQELVRIMDEAKARVEALTSEIKNHMGDGTELIIGPYKVTYHEVTKNVVDTDAMKAAGIYAQYCKKQITRPFRVS